MLCSMFESHIGCTMMPDKNNYALDINIFVVVQHQLIISQQQATAHFILSSPQVSSAVLKHPQQPSSNLRSPQASLAVLKHSQNIPASSNIHHPQHPQYPLKILISPNASLLASLVTLLKLHPTTAVTTLSTLQQCLLKVAPSRVQGVYSTVQYCTVLYTTAVQQSYHSSTTFTLLLPDSSTQAGRHNTRHHRCQPTASCLK